MVDPDGHWFWIPVAVAAAYAGTEGHPFNSSAWSNFNFQAAAIAGLAAAAGQWGYAAAGAGLGGAVAGGALGGAVGGGLTAAANDQNILMGGGQGMAQGELSGFVSGGLSQWPIFTGRTGMLKTPLPSMAGAYVGAEAMGGDGKAAARGAFAQDTLTNFLGFSWDKATGYKSGPAQTAGSDKAYLMSRPLDIRFVPFLGEALAVLGIGHLAITNGTRTKELFGPTRGSRSNESHVDLYPTETKPSSLSRFSQRWGTAYEPLTTSFSSFQVPTNSIHYNMLGNNSNLAIYNLMRGGQ